METQASRNSTFVTRGVVTDNALTATLTQLRAEISRLRGIKREIAAVYKEGVALTQFVEEHRHRGATPGGGAIVKLDGLRNQYNELTSVFPNIDSDIDVLVALVSQRKAEKDSRKVSILSTSYEPPASKDEYEGHHVSDGDYIQPSKAGEDIHDDRILGEELVESPDRKFKIANQRVLLTYKTHIPKDLINEKFKGKPFFATRVEAAHEIASSKTDYEHTHVFVDFGKNFQSTNARIFDVFPDVPHGHIRKIKNAHQVPKVLNYLAKEDPDNAHLKTETPNNKVIGIWECKNRSEALEHYAGSNLNVANSVLAVWGAKPEQESEDIPQLKWTWQQDVADIAETPLGDQEGRLDVWWYYGKKGGEGKSTLGKYLYLTKKAYFFPNVVGGSEAIANGLLNAKETWDFIPALAFDFPRSAEDHKFYGGIEGCANGLLFNSKYNAQTINLGGRKRVICFANFLPDVSQLSLDRWNIFELLPKEGTSWDDEDHFEAIHLPTGVVAKREKAMRLEEENAKAEAKIMAELRLKQARERVYTKFGMEIPKTWSASQGGMPKQSTGLPLIHGISEQEYDQILRNQGTVNYEVTQEIPEPWNAHEIS